MCFPPICRYHIILIGNIEDLLQKLHAFFFNYQHVDCLYTIFKYRFSGKIVFKSGQIFDNLQRAVHFNQQNRGVDRLPSIAKKRLLRKKYKKHLLSSFQKTKSTQTSGSVFAERMEQVKKTKFELEVTKTVDCRLDGHDNYTSNLVSFKIKTFWKIFDMSDFENLFAFKKSRFGSFYSVKTTYLAPFVPFLKSRILHWSFHYELDFDLKKIQRVRNWLKKMQRVRFWHKIFSSSQILNRKVNNVSAFWIKIFHFFQS